MIPFFAFPPAQDLAPRRDRAGEQDADFGPGGRRRDSGNAACSTWSTGQGQRLADDSRPASTDPDGGRRGSDRRAASDQPDPAPGERVRSACSAVTTLTGCRFPFKPSVSDFQSVTDNSAGSLTYGRSGASTGSQPPSGGACPSRLFGSFNWHNLAFDPYKLSPRAGLRAMSESLCGVDAQQRSPVYAPPAPASR